MRGSTILGEGENESYFQLDHSCHVKRFSDPLPCDLGNTIWQGGHISIVFGPWERLVSPAWTEILTDTVSLPLPWEYSPEQNLSNNQKRGSILIEWPNIYKYVVRGI